MSGGHLGVIIGTAISVLLLVAVALWVRRYERVRGGVSPSGKERP